MRIAAAVHVTSPDPRVAVVALESDARGCCAEDVMEALEQPRARGQSVVVDVSALAELDAATVHTIRYAYEKARRNPARSLVLLEDGDRAADGGSSDLGDVPRTGSRAEAIALALAGARPAAA
jgi:hypothetical protein